MSRRTARALSVAAVFGGTAALAGVVVALVVVGAGVAGLEVQRLRRHGARCRRVGACLPDTIEVLVLTVHAGHTPVTAITAAAPFVPALARPALDAVVHRLQRGQRLADALGALVDHFGPPAHPAVDAIAAADRYGLPLGPVLDRLAAEARAVRRRAAEADARTLPVRLSVPLVTCTLPSFVLLAVAPVALAAVSSLQGIAP